MGIFINARRALGDCIYFLPILKKIRDRYRGAEIVLVSWDSVHELFAESGYADRCISNSSYLEMSPAEASGLIKDVDIYIDLQTTPESAIGVKRSSAGQKIGVFLPDQPTKQEELYTDCLKWEKGEHVSSYLLRGFSRCLDIDPETESIPIPRPNRLINKVDILLRDLGFGEGEFLAGIHPGAKEQVRRWTPEKWAGVADWLASVRHAHVLLIGSDLASWGGMEIGDLKDNDRIYRLARHKPTDLTGSTAGPLLLAEVMRQMGLYVGLDTGPTHLAAAVGVPTLGVYLYRSADHFNAWTLIAPNARVIARENLDDLEVEEVAAEIRALLRSS